VALRPGLWWLFAVWPFVVAFALMVAAQVEGLRSRARLIAHVGGLVGLALGVWGVAGVAAETWSWWPGLRALRIGSLDVSLDVLLDPLAAGMTLALLLLAAGSLSAGAEALGRTPSRGAVVALARLPVLVGTAIFAVAAGNWLALALGWFGAGLAGRALADDLAPPTSGAPRGGVMAGRLGEAALLAAIALSFWSGGGRWLADGFEPDYRERFGVVLEPSAQAARPTTIRVAQRPAPTAMPDRLPRPPALRTRPKAAPLPRTPPPQLTPVGGTMATLTMTTHPGAEVYLGIAELSDLQANQGALPRCEEQPAWTAAQGPQLNVSCVTTAPFVDKRLPPGRQRIAIVPGAGGIVGGRGHEAAEIEVRLDPGSRARVVTLGASLGFIDTVHQRTIAPKLGLYAPLDDPSRRPQEMAWLLVLAALGMAASATLVRPQGAAEPSLRRARPVLAGAAQAVPLLLAGHLLARAASLGVSLPLGAVVLGASVALLGAFAAAQPRSGERILTWLALAHGGAIVAAAGLASAEVAVALALGHGALWFAAMGPLSLDEEEAAPSTEPLGLRHELGGPAVFALVGAAVAVAGVLPLGGFFGRAAGLAGLPATGSPPRWLGWGLLLAAQLGVALASGRLARLVLSGEASAVAQRVGKAAKRRRGYLLALGMGGLVWLGAGAVATASTAAFGGSGAGLWRGWMNHDGVGSPLIAGLVLVAAVGGLLRSSPRRGEGPRWASKDPQPLTLAGELAASLVAAGDRWLGRGWLAVAAPLEAAGAKLGARGAMVVAVVVVVALLGWVGRG